jgi:GxxExxY protein
LKTDDSHSLTQNVIGLAMKVHRTLGPGFLESVYLNALAYELRRAGLQVELGQHIKVRYENVIVGDFIVDLMVNDFLICELKATIGLTKADEVQLVNYLVATNRDYGLLFNFGTTTLQFKRKHRLPAAHLADVDLHHPVNPVNPV